MAAWRNKLGVCNIIDSEERPRQVRRRDRWGCGSARELFSQSTLWLSWCTSLRGGLGSIPRQSFFFFTGSIPRVFFCERVSILACAPFCVVRVGAARASVAW
eukprot:1832649-Rhodomonas_salina.1